MSNFRPVVQTAAIMYIYIFLWQFKHDTVLVVQDSSDASSVLLNAEEEKCAIERGELWSDLTTVTCRLLAEGGAVSCLRVQSCAPFISALTSGLCFSPMLIKGCTVHLETKYKVYKEKKKSQTACCSVVTMVFISSQIRKKKNRLNVKH